MYSLQRTPRQRKSKNSFPSFARTGMMLHRIEGGVAVVGLAAFTQPEFNRRPLENHLTSPLVIVDAFLELARADQIGIVCSRYGIIRASCLTERYSCDVLSC